MGKLICLIGPSGSGKTTIGQYLQTKGIPEVVSTTTRKPRVGEENHISYHFCTKNDFEQKIKENFFVEQTCYSGDWYGTSVNEINEKLENYELCYSVIEMNGYKNLKNGFQNHVVSIFLNISEKECIKRMKNRGDTEENISKRIQNFKKTNEFDNGKYCDYICNMEQSFSNVYNDIDEILKKIKKDA